MPEMHLKQPGFTCSACGRFTKNKERIQKITKTGNASYIYKNELWYINFYMVYKFLLKTPLRLQINLYQVVVLIYH